MVTPQPCYWTANSLTFDHGLQPIQSLAGAAILRPATNLVRLATHRIEVIVS
jgi:hypothetical protein